MPNPHLLERIRETDIVHFLENIGHSPSKIRGKDYWYHSPLRHERTPSFKVNSTLNRWYDHGTGLGGNLIDFGIRYYHCSIREFLEIITSRELPSPEPTSSARPQASGHSARLQIMNSRPLTHPALIWYLKQRAITPSVGKNFCKQVHFRIGSRQYFSLGFENNAGGYELRNAFFKGGSSPKDITLIDHHTPQLAVFEGFFDFLSYQVINSRLRSSSHSALILNSLAFFEKSRPLMEKYDQILLMLDRDAAGRKCTQDACLRNEKYVDHSEFYQGSKDLNEWLVSQS